MVLRSHLLSSAPTSTGFESKHHPLTDLPGFPGTRRRPEAPTLIQFQSRNQRRTLSTMCSDNLNSKNRSSFEYNPFPDPDDQAG
jgi:hypothetical protein